jgi:solute carrier family 6 (neurotransmitter transporter, taurine) member 6
MSLIDVLFPLTGYLGVPQHDQGTATSSPNVHNMHGAAIARTGSYIFSDTGSRMYTDATSVRSLASIGMGSTDGRRMVIRRVPNSPTELMTIINPPT